MGDPPSGAAVDVQKESEWGRRIALVSIGLSIALAAIKIAIGFRSGSSALTSDGFESAGDVLSSAMVYVGLSLASKPPDYEHPYGHGRYETLAGLGVGAMLLLTAAGIFWNSLLHLHQRNDLPFYALYPLVLAIGVKFGLSAVKFSMSRRIKSMALESDAWHDITDLLSTSVATVCILLTLHDPERFGIADHLGGLIIGVIIFFLSLSVVRQVVDQLLDTMPEPARLIEIRSAALSVPGALGIEKCFARRTGLRYHVDLHLEVDPAMTVQDSHEIATQVRSQIKKNLHWVADVLVHVEPSLLPESELVQYRRASEQLHV